jgi:DNA invertase Pin-like site-specific DNA recombinase
MTKAYSYIRFSSPKQEAGDSYPRQHRLCVAYCKEKKLDLVSDADYTFFDSATSAFDGKHLDDGTELSRFLLLVKDGSIAPGSVLIVESLDRLSRQHVRAALPRFMDLLNAGITIHSLHDNRTYTQDYDQFDLFQSIMEMTRSHGESLLKSQRVSAAWQTKQGHARSAGKPLGKTKPAWLDLVLDAAGNPVGFEPNALVDVVKTIFKLTLDGYGKPTVAGMLNEAGHPSFKGKTWGASSVDQILKSPTVLGIYQPYTGKGKTRTPRGEPIVDYYPTIIDKDTFDKARAAVTGRFIARGRKQTPRFQIWQGIAKCSLCQSPMHTFNKGKKGVQLGYMRCYSAKKRMCTAKQIRINKSELVFKEMLAKLNILALVQSSASSLSAQLESVIGQLIGERAKLAEYKAAYQGRRSTTVFDLICETEDAIGTLDAQELALTASLAADTIVDKSDFFARLDLESYKGRSRANSILKRLKIQVSIDTLGNYYGIDRDGKRVLDILDSPDHGVCFYPASQTASALVQVQEGDFTPPLVTDDEGP